MTSLFAKPLTWDRLWSLVTNSKGVVTHGLYLDGDPVEVRHYGIMHPLYWNNSPWTVYRKSGIVGYIDGAPWVETGTYQTMNDGLMRDLVEFENMWYDDPEDGIEVYY